ncbi:MAG: PDZ domain-containing protein [Gemmatimonadaceae bacterium]|nr:PDZ domain-containing protein [Gemmatimonadaceae bacterium]
MLRRFRALALAALSSAVVLPAQSAPTWLRYPAISPDGQTLVFTWRGDLWRVASAGGTATQLTQHAAHDFNPVWSHDGKWIAFASDRRGNFDIYIMAASGGEPRRLTFHSATETPYSFSPDDKQLLFGAARMDAASNRQYPTGAQPELWSVDVAGGRPAQLLTTPAEDARWDRTGQWLAYHDKKGGENVWRKHHTSAITRDLWLYDAKAGTHKRITGFAGEDRSPLFTDNDKALLYLSEESGTFNVHRIGINGGASTQLTKFTDAPVRFLSRADNGTVAFSQDGQLYTMAPGASPKRVAVAIAADAKANSDLIQTITSGARDVTVSPSGKEVAFIARGDVWTASVEGGVTKRITNTPANETNLSFAPDGKSLIYASERDGKWGIYEARRVRDTELYFYAATLVRESPVIVNDRINYQPTYSPNGKELAWIEGLNTLKVMDVATKQSRTLLDVATIFATTPNHHFRWSPDGKWMLFDLSTPGLAPSEVGLVATDGKSAPINLTRSGFNDGGAEWILGGNAMIWASNRDGLRSVAQTGPAQNDVYGMFFTRDAWDRYRLTKEELALVRDAEEKAPKPKPDTGKAKADTATKAMSIDLEGIETRKSRFTIHSSSLADALVSKDGEMLYYLARFERGLNLWSTNLRTRETKQVLGLNAASASMQWDKDQKNIFLVSDGGISKIDPGSAKRDAVSFAGELTLNVDAERAAQFDHVWRKTRDTFYKKGYHGADWTALRTMYEKQLSGVSNGYEFAELLAEMLGELNISHSGASFTASAPTDDATASLGIFLDQSYRGVGVKIDEVIRDGPLDKAAISITKGTIIESVDGVTIGADMDIAQLLNRKAGKSVLLGIVDGAKRSEIVVKPLTGGAEGQLLYARWVRRNAEEVEKASDGQLGYIHIPGMSDGPYRNTFEEVLGKYADRRGIIVDTRFNGGGDLVADLAMFLSGKRFFDYTTDTRSNGFEPNFRWTKPSVAMANEANYSDGHCFAFTYKELKIGPLVGMPTPGTCTFAGWESLGDGLRWGVPGVGVKETTRGTFLENQQTDPDVTVMNEYPIVSRGRDQQLEAAIAALRKLIK